MDNSSTLKIDFAPAVGRRVLVALSGGADSVALLRLLLDDGRAEVLAAHYEHGLRGRSSLEDAEFCQKLCAEWGVPLYLAHGNVKDEAEKRGEGLETAARRLRHDYLESVRRQSESDLIALAHHLDDQAETVLMHLFRGSGMTGLTGMQTLSGPLYRPLLGVRKEALTAFLRARNIPWREDSTNAVADTPRNVLRLRTLPEIQTVYPGAPEAIAREANILKGEDDYLKQQTQALLSRRGRQLPNGAALALNGEKTHIALLRRALRALSPISLDARQTEVLAEMAINRRGKLQLTETFCAEACAGGLYFVDAAWTPPEPVRVQLRGTTTLPGICTLSAEPWDGEPICSNGPDKTLSRAALTGAVLRTRQAGDRIRPFGMRGEKSLSDYLTDRKIDRPLRDVMPLIAVERRVLWLPGVGISQEAALKRSEEGVYLSCQMCF